MSTNQPAAAAPGLAPDEAEIYDDAGGPVESSNTAGGNFDQQAGGDGWILGEDAAEPPIPVPPPVPGQGQGQPQQVAPGTQYQQPAPANQPGSGDVREIRLPTGHVLRGTPDEIIRQQQDIINRQAAAAPANYQPADGRRASANRGPGQAVTGRTSSDTGRGPAMWDSARSTAFYETFAKDPMAAMDMWAKDYFGSDDPPAAFDRSYSISTQVSDRIAIADFLANRADFPASKEASTMLVKRLEQDGQDLTAWNLEVAFNQLVREGVLAPISGQPQAVVVQPQQSQPVYPQSNGQQQPPTRPVARGQAAPPAIPGSSGGNGQMTDRSNLRLTLDEFETLNPAEMREYMASHRIPDRFFTNPSRRG